MKRNVRKNWNIVAILLIAVMLLSLSACSSGAGDEPADFNSGRNESTPIYTPMAPGGAAEEDIAYAPAPATVAPDAGGGAYESEVQAAPELTGFTGDDNIDASQSGRKLTFAADFAIDTKSYDADYTKLNDLIVQSGGYVASEQTSDYTGRNAIDGRYTALSARVPTEGYNSFLDSVSEIGEITQKNKASQDLTTEYFDTEARIEMLEIRKERLMGYLVEATEAESIVAFERELSDVLYELDQYQGNKRRIDQLVEYSTVDITLTELITPETIGKDGEPLGDRASSAFALSLNGVGDFLENVAVFFAGAAPVIVLLIVIVVIICVIVMLVRKLRKKFRERFPAKEKPVKQKRRQYQQMPMGYYQMPQTPQTPPAMPVEPPVSGEPKAAGEPEPEAKK